MSLEVMLSEQAQGVLLASARPFRINFSWWEFDGSHAVRISARCIYRYLMEEVEDASLDKFIA